MLSFTEPRRALSTCTETLDLLSRLLAAADSVRRGKCGCKKPSPNREEDTAVSPSRENSRPQESSQLTSEGNVSSTRMLGPVASGPKAQMERAASRSQSYFVWKNSPSFFLEEREVPGAIEPAFPKTVTHPTHTTAETTAKEGWCQESRQEIRRVGPVPTCSR